MAEQSLSNSEPQRNDRKAVEKRRKTRGNEGRRKKRWKNGALPFEGNAP